MAFTLLSKKRRVKGMADWPTSVWGRTGIGAMRRIFTTKRRAARRKTIRRARARSPEPRFSSAIEWAVERNQTIHTGRRCAAKPWMAGGVDEEIYMRRETQSRKWETPECATTCRILVRWRKSVVRICVYISFFCRRSMFRKDVSELWIYSISTF